MKVITLGQHVRSGDGLVADAVEYASRANAILGIRDSGKSYTATGIAEQLFEHGIPFFAFDPIGRWRFMRLPSDKAAGCAAPKGYPVVVAGGAAPDLPLTPDNAKKLVRSAMLQGVSMVLDLYSVGLSKSDWRKIVRESIETILYESEGHGLRHVFLEEAAEFIPQRVRDGLTYSEVEKLARMGGNVGCGITIINQRAEEVNKAVLELCDNLILHRQRGKNSLLSLRKWLEAGNVKPPKEITDTLADLPTGEAWAWLRGSVPVRIKIAAKQSFDPDRRALAAKTMKIGTAKPVDVSAFVAQMKAALVGKPAPRQQPVKPPRMDKGGLNSAGSQIKTRPAPPAPGNHQKQEGQVDEKEAKALRDENARLKQQVDDLYGQVNALSGYGSTHDAGQPLSGGSSGISNGGNLESIYAYVVERASKDPAVIRVLVERPEIEVKVRRQVIEIDGASTRGRIARLIADGFYDSGATNTGTRNELKRTGPDVNNGTISKLLYELVEKGFMTKESGDRFVAVPGMKVNVVEVE